MNPLVTITGNKEVVTDSLTVAKYFKKNHQHVLRDIKRIIEAGTVNESDFGRVGNYEKHQR